jgi:hypothetical protein
MTRSLLALSLCSLVVSCATAPSFYGERRLAPADVGKMIVLVDDSGDNGLLRGNVPLMRACAEEVAGALRALGVNAVAPSGPDVDVEAFSHVLVLQSLGITTTQGSLPPAPTPTPMPVPRRRGDLRRNVYSDSTTDTIQPDGVTYKVNEVRVRAMVLRLVENDEPVEVCSAQAQGDGMNLLERAWNMTRTANLFGYEKNLDSVYRQLFVSVASSLFAK